jgi:uncharacterized membrane protein YkoI
MIRMALAALLLAGASNVALADTNHMVQAGSLSVAQVTQALQTQGYTVDKIEYDDGNYEVKATMPGQHQTRLEISATTGRVLSRQVDDRD